MSAPGGRGPTNRQSAGLRGARLASRRLEARSQASPGVQDTADGGGARRVTRRGVPRVTHFRPEPSGLKGTRTLRTTTKPARAAGVAALVPTLLPPAAASAAPGSARPRPAPPSPKGQAESGAAPFGQLLPTSTRAASRDPGPGRGHRRTAGRERPSRRTPGRTLSPAVLSRTEGGGGGPCDLQSVRSQAEPGPGGEICTHGPAPRPRRRRCLCLLSSLGTCDGLRIARCTCD